MFCRLYTSVKTIRRARYVLLDNDECENEVDDRIKYDRNETKHVRTTSELKRNRAKRITSTRYVHLESDDDDDDCVKDKKDRKEIKQIIDGSPDSLYYDYDSDDDSSGLHSVESSPNSIDWGDFDIWGTKEWDDDDQDAYERLQYKLQCAKRRIHSQRKMYYSEITTMRLRSDPQHSPLIARKLCFYH